MSEKYKIERESGDCVRESEYNKDFKDESIDEVMPKKKVKKSFFERLAKETVRARTTPEFIVPQVRVKVPKIRIAKDIKDEFRRTWDRLLEDEKKGVVRRKRYGPD